MENGNRKRLREIAAELFSSKGYDAVGIQEVVNAAEVTKPTLYYYFGSKQGLLDAVCKEHFSPLIARLQTVCEGYDGDLMKLLGNLVSSYVAYGLEHRASTYLQLSVTYLPASHAANSIVSPYMDELIEVFVSLFKRAVPEHGNLSGHEDVLALTLIGALNNYMINLLNGKIPASEKGNEAVVKQYMYGIYVL